MSQLTTHILNTTLGKPASDVDIILYSQTSNGWSQVAIGTTNADGRLTGLLPVGQQLPFGVYKLVFNTKPYFDRLGMATFYPFVEIVFDVQTAEHYHVPLLLNPFGYSTYRGS